MGIFERMLSTQSLMFLYILAGIIIVKAKVLKPEGRSSFIGLLINVTLPCMILHSFEQDAGLDALIAGGKLLIASAACCLSAMGLGRLLWRWKSLQRQAVLEFATMFSNAGNAGLPIVSLVFGAEGVFWAELASQAIGATASFTTMMLTVYRPLLKRERAEAEASAA